MNRHRLECFIALAEELHFHRAAARCHISQPAMSQQIKQLETELRVQLAIRSKRAVALTPAGEAFLVEARKIVRQMDLAGSIARRTDSGEIGRIAVGVTGPALYVVFPEVAQAFRASNPEVGLVVHEMTTSQQEEALRDNDIQLGILHPPIEVDDVACDVIANPAFVLAFPEHHPLAERPSVRMSELAQEPLVLFPRVIAPQLYDTIIALCQSEGFSPRITLEAHPAQSIIAMVASGLGIGFIASPVQQLPRPGVVYRPISGPRPYMNIGVAYRSDAMSPAASIFVQIASTVGRELSIGWPSRPAANRSDR